MPRRSDVSPEETRQRIIEAAAEVFARRWFAASPIEEITEAAGFSRGAFHWHFDSKTDLLLAVIGSRLDAATSGKDQLVSEAGDPTVFNRTQRGRATKRDREATRRWVLLMMEFWLLAARDPNLAEAARDLKERLRRATASQVDELAAASGRELPLPARTIASALMALDDGFALQGLLDPTITSDTLWDVVDYLTSTLTPSSNASGSP